MWESEFAEGFCMLTTLFLNGLCVIWNMDFIASGPITFYHFLQNLIKLSSSSLYTFLLNFLHLYSQCSNFWSKCRLIDHSTSEWEDGRVFVWCTFLFIRTSKFRLSHGCSYFLRVSGFKKDSIHQIFLLATSEIWVYQLRLFLICS